MKTGRKRIADICSILSAISIGISLFGMYRFLEFCRSVREEERSAEETVRIRTSNDEKAVSDSSANEFTETQRYDRLFEVNGDYYAWLEWDGGLLSLPVMKTADNDYYLTHDFFDEQTLGGSAFADCLTENEDDVLVIYGHSVFPKTCSILFTPLLNLREQEFADRYPGFSLLYREKEVRYRVFAVCETDPVNDGWDYSRLRLNVEEKKEFAETAMKKSLITVKGPSENADYAVLQTCKNEDGEIKVLVIAEKTAEYPYE